MTIRLNGATSGYVEIDAPAVAGNTSLTLPSESGTVATTSNTFTLTGNSPSNRNILYNGAMQVAQRGTSTASITASGFHTADRWQTVLGNLGTWTQSVENDAPTGSGLRKSLKMLCTTADAAPAANDLLAVAQLLEGQDLQRIAKGTASALQVTLSFWVKSNVTGTYIAYLYDNNNTRHVAASYSISASATWERKTVTFPADTTGAFDNDNALSLYALFHLGAGSDFTSGTLATTWASYTAANRAVGQTNVAAATNNYWQVTGVQLEIGPVATSFEFKSYGQELAECQRYYYSLASGNVMPLGLAYAWTATQAECVCIFPVTMRTTPTVSAVTGTDYYRFRRNSGQDDFNSLLTTGAESSRAILLYNDGQTSSTAGQAGVMFTNNASASIAFRAEL